MEKISKKIHSNCILMSNNSWKQYGGISDLNNYNFINK